MLDPLRRSAILVLSIAPVIFVGCGKDAASSSSSSSSSAAALALAPASAAARAPTSTAGAALTTAAAAPPAAGGACSFAGSWTGVYPPGPYPFSGHPFGFTINADGNGETDSERAKSEFAWKAEGSTFSIHGTKIERGGRYACAMGDLGKYTYQFTPDCSAVTLKLVSDPCKGRSTTMDGAAMKRK